MGPRLSRPAAQDAGEAAGRPPPGGARFWARADFEARGVRGPRLNPPERALPFGLAHYGQPFYKGYSWERKV